jgi:DNA-binding NarL/FixJ family response regulator
MRVVIADDHAIMRGVLIDFLRDAFPHWDFDQAADLEEAKQKIANAATDLMMIDLGMPGMDGFRSLPDLRAANPDMKLAVLSGIEDRRVILDCLGAGVHGYIRKADASREILMAIETIMGGGLYAPPALSCIKPATTIKAPPPEPPRIKTGAPLLTPRQREVMGLLANGLSTQMIARQMGLGPGTVKVHLAGLYRALGVRTRMEAVLKAGTLLH